MVSCSTPSHHPPKNFKMDRDRDRPRSTSSGRLDDLKLPSPPSSSSRDRDKVPAFPRFDSGPDRNGSDRAPDKAPAGFSSSAPRASSGFDRDGRERGDGGREFWRKGYGGSGAERENGDGGDESGERLERCRNSLRKAQGYERDGIGRSGADRHYVVKTSDRDRSERSDCPRTPSRKILEQDRESFDKVESMRSSGRRSYGSDYRQEGAEVSNNSPVREERESNTVGAKFARRGSGSDKERSDRGDSSGKASSASGRDGQEGCDLRRSPSGKVAGFARDGKDALKLLSKRAHGLDRDGPADLAKGSPRREYGIEKDGTKGSPRKDYGTEKDPTRTPRTSPRKAPELEKEATETHKLSPRKSIGTDRDSMGTEEVHRVSPKSKRCFNREEEKSVFSAKGHGSSSDEGDTKTWNRSSSSRALGWGQDAVEEPKLHGANGSQEDGGRKKSPQNPTSFFHISKRHRSDRDRGRREELVKAQAIKDVQPDDCGIELEATGEQNLVQKTDTEVAVKEEEAVNVDGKAMDEADQVVHISPGNRDVTVSQSDERQLDTGENSQVPDSSSSPGEKSEMEEGELEPEEEMVKEEQKEVENKELTEEKRVETEMEEDNIVGDDDSHVHVRKEEEASEIIIVEAPKAESQLHASGSGSGSGSDEDQQEVSERCKHGELGEIVDRKEENGAVRDKEDNTDLRLCKTAIASTSKDIEIGERSKGGLTLDLLHERILTEDVQPEQWNPVTIDKDHDPSRELTLSLCTKPVAAEVGRSKQKVLLTGSQSNLNDKFKSQETLKEVYNIQVTKKEKDLAGGAEELGEHSHAGYGHKHKKLKMDSLQLSLALPGISVAPTRPSYSHLAGPVEPERSFQSLTHTQTQTQNLSLTQTHTNSDGFTTSFSQSHSFVHNPSCSLNCNSLDNQELSCGGSRQISQGNEQMSHRSWQTPSANEKMSNGAHGVTSLSQDRLKHRRGIPLYQQILQNGNMQPHQGFPSVTGSIKSSGSNQISQRSHQIGQRLQVDPKVPEISLQDLKNSDRQGNMQRELSERLHQQETRLASNQQVGSKETQSGPHLPLERGRLGDYPTSPAKRFSSVRNEDMVIGRTLSNEKIGLREIATESVAVMAQKLQELSDSFLDGLKNSAKEMLGSIEKREEFITLQEILQRRTDLTEDTLLRSNRTQLEILVAFKTGLQSFVQKSAMPLTYKALIEIFLQTRCRNIDCQQSLPIYRCECKICSQKSGFCHECMCVVCSKFDSDSNTCRWVGCDLCLHWCHTDCGLRMSYIAPAPSVQGAESSEMQFKCVACGHPLELFGFVKEAFRKCADVWSAETLAKELDCIQRIFHGSEDMRGKQLFWKAGKMLQKLESKVDAKQVCRSMLQFFNEGNALQDGTSKQPYSLKPNEASDRVTDAAKEALLKMNPVAGTKFADLDKARAALQTYDKELEEKRTEVAELQYDRARKKAEIEDIESMVRMKQAETKMFQMRADEARQNANGLQHIAAVKREKIEEDYACKYAKLRLNDAEERRIKRLEEVQALERAQNDYQSMKTKTEAEIKDLLMKMEMTKQQLV